MKKFAAIILVLAFLSAPLLYSFSAFAADSQDGIYDTVGNFQTLFGAKTFKCTYGSATASQNGITVETSGGKATLSEVFAEDTSEECSYLITVRITSTTGGTIFVNALDRSGDTVPASDMQSLKVGDSVYSFVVGGAFNTLQYSFEGVSSPETVNGTLKLQSGKCRKIGEARKNTCGTISSCRLADGKVTVKGSISTEAAVKYSDYKTVLYAVPLWEVGTAPKTAPVAVADFSTQFEISAAAESKTLSLSASVFFVYLEKDDKKIFVGAGTPSVGNATGYTGTSVAALDGAEIADIFESNVSTAIFDVNLDDLLNYQANQDTVQHSFCGEVFGINSEFVGEFDRKVDFCTSAGIYYYFRLYIGKHNGFDFSASDKNAAVRAGAALDYFVSRYNGAAGFIIGKNMNYSGILTPENAGNEALKCALVSSVVSSRAPLSSLIVSFADCDAAKGCVTESEGAAVLMYRLSKLGVARISVILESSDADSGDISKTVRISSAAKSYGIDCTGAGMVCIADGGDAGEISEKYRVLCAAAAENGVRIVALDYENCADTSAVTDSLKITLAQNNIIPVKTTVIPRVSDIDFDNTYVLWDFTGSYDTGGFSVGGSFYKAVTDFSSLSAPTAGAGGMDKTRVLKALPQPASQDDGTKAETGAGILACGFDAPMDFHGTVAKFEFAVLSDTAETAEVTVIFKNSSNRAEMSCNVECNTESSVACNLSDFEGAVNVEYVALIVRFAGKASLEVKKVTLSSAADGNLPERFRDISGNIDGADGKNAVDPAIYTVVFTAAAVTVGIFTILLRKKDKNRKNEKNTRDN